ncbi:MAG: hypothetical protein NT018_12920 [Armatimonadetes bacterium]|nr:hypothetical protein [Armatimonadota bacterium]
MTSNRYHNTYIDGAVCFWTSSIINHLPVLRSPTACLRVLETLDNCRARYGVKLLGYVIMPEHIHIAIWAEKSSTSQVFIRQFLKMTSAEIASLASSAAEKGNKQAVDWYEQFRNRARQGARVRVWKERGRAFPVTREDGLIQKLNYMHENPIRRNLVTIAEDWKYSSASHYAGKSALISIDQFDW